MGLQERLSACLRQAVENHEAAGVSLLVLKNGKELCHAREGYADIAAGKQLRRDSIFRLYSQSKPVTAAAAMILVDRGILDLMAPVEQYLPGFANPRVVEADGTIRPAIRGPWILDLLGMTSGLCYPDADPAGQYAARIFDDNHAQILAGGGMSTLDFCNRLGEQPLAFEPGTRWRYGTSADILGAVSEAASCYKRVPGSLETFSSLHLAVGQYDREPAFESGGAGLVSTLDDYAAFANMLINGGKAAGGRILSEAAVRYMTTPQLTGSVRKDVWDSLGGYNYSCLMRVCDHPGRAAMFTVKNEYGWDGWLGTYFANLPDQGITFLLAQNVTDMGTGAVTRKCRNILAACMDC